MTVAVRPRGGSEIALERGLRGNFRHAMAPAGGNKTIDCPGGADMFLRNSWFNKV